MSIMIKRQNIRLKTEGFRYMLFACFAFSLAVDAGEFNGSATITSDYAYRGYSKSRGNPAAQGNLEYSHKSGIYTGLWLSQVSFDNKSVSDRATVELNPYIGWTVDLSEDWRTDLSAGRYIYAGKIAGLDADYNEFHTALHYRDLLSARLSIAYDAYNLKATTLNYELVSRYNLLDTLKLSAGLGLNQAHQLFDANYFYWNAGFTWNVIKHIAVDLRYIDSSLNLVETTYTDNYFNLQPLSNHYLLSLSAGF